MKYFRKLFECYNLRQTVLSNRDPLKSRK